RSEPGWLAKVGGLDGRRPEGVRRGVLVSPPSPSGFGKGPDAFVTSLYNGVLGRAPEPAGLSYWSKRFVSKVKPRTIATLFWGSRERRTLFNEHNAPP